MSKSPSSHNYHVTELFDQFINGTTLKSVLITFRRICLLLDLEPGPFNQFYPTLKKGIVCNKNWKSQSIFSKIEKKAFNKIYHSSGSSSGRSSGIGVTGGHSGSPHGSNNILKNNNCLVIGGGPCGLRTAIELQLLGARHVIITEKRDRFSRNNVLHLWPFVIADLKQLAGKKFYGKFCAGSIDHVSIRQLQLMLLKVALIIGCEFIENVAFEEICPHNIRSSRETIKETSPESEADASGDCKVQQSTTQQQSPIKRKLYSTTEETESEKGTNCDSATNDDNQENIDNSNVNNGDNEMGCSPTDSYYGVKTESRRLSNCSCCCHLHRQGDGGRHFWPHLPKGYIGAYAHFSLTSSTPSTASTLVNYDLLLEKLHTYPFDILIGGDGRRNTLNDNFPRKEFRGKLAIAITANFINNHTLAEAQIPEISGISFIYHQEMFKSLYNETGIDLENICYYKDDTHYFVMTAKKSSLLQRGVLINDYSDTRALLASSNIDRSQLLNYARDAAKWTTGLDTPNFALNHYGEADVAMFDFTSMYAADNACRAKRIIRTTYKNRQHDCSRCNCDNEPCKKSKSDTNDLCQGSGETSHEHCVDNKEEAEMEDKAKNETDEGLLLISLVGDSLLEPFWPTGSGCGRGFLSAMDAAWLVRQWAVKKCKSILDEEKILQVLSEREAIYRLLAQTKSENLSQNCASYSINPVTRYPNLNSSTLLPHQCRHLLYDHLPSPVIEPRSKLTMAEKRARRATIATTSPFSCSGANNGNGDGEVIMESRARVEREFMAISRERERNQRNSESGNGEKFSRPYIVPSTLEDDESNLAAHREFEDSLAAFEENYRGLLASEADPSEGGTQLSTSVPNRSHIPNSVALSGNFALDMSPSASNLITMAKSRARDIESAFRHRRQRQSQFRRSETDELQGGGKVHQKAQQQCYNHLRQQLRSKAAWFLDQKAQANSENSLDSNNSNPLVKRESFSERIKDLEAKLYAASGLSYLSDDNSDPKEEPPLKLPSTKTGINVMMTATQLQQLFNPKLQEEKLRQQAKLKATKDIKYVGKISKEDWNVKPFEEGSGVSSESNKAVSNAKPKSPPPPQRVELFRNKLNEIQSKLEHIDDHHQPERRVKETVKNNQTNNGEWISMLKNELTEKAARKPEIQTEPAVLRRSPSTLDNPFRKEARREAREAAAAASGQNGVKSNASSSKLSSPTKEKIRIIERSGSMVAKVCAKCGLIVATVDKILVSGTLFHRSCLKCISCSVTLRMSEVRNTGNGSLASLITGSNTVLNNSKENGFNYKCSDCTSNSKSKVSSIESPVIGKLMGSTKSSITSTPGSTTDNRMTSSFDGNLEPLAKSSSARVFPSLADQKMASTTDDYEARLKERMKWKEMFLLSNNNIDLRSGHNKTDGSKDVGSNKKKSITSPIGGEGGKTETTPGGKASTPGGQDCSRNRLNERIEYENISMTSEMVDDDELTKLLNLGSDHWESGAENDEPDSDESDKDDDDDDDDDDSNDDRNKSDGRNKKAHDSDKDEDDDNGDVDDEDRQTTTSSDSWDTSDSTDNDFDSDQFDESGVSDGGDLIYHRHKHPSLSLENNHASIKEEIVLPQIVVHKESEYSPTISPKKAAITTEAKPNVDSSASFQPNESSSVSRQSSEIISNDNIKTSTSSTLEKFDEVDDDSDKTEKNSSSKNTDTSGSDVNTINSKINDIEDNTIPSSTTLEEKEFRMIVDEMEKKTNKEPMRNQVNYNGSSNINTESHMNKQITDDLAPSSSDTNDLNFDSDSDSKTSLSSLSINVSDTYDDINLLSIWDESGNCDELTDSPVKPSNLKKTSNKKKRTVNRSSVNENKQGVGLFKSKTEASIPDRSPYHNHRKDYLGRGLIPLESRYNNDAKKDDNLCTPTKRLSFSFNKDTLDKTNEGLQSIDNVINDYENYSAKMSPQSKGENYSKIPVLAARVIAANEGINLDNSLSSATTSTSHNTKYKPSYSGSFTEKLLQRCRSSPSIPFIGDSLSRWSTSKMQLSSSPTKVLSITKALNAQAKNTSSPSTKENHQPSPKLIKSQPQQETTKNHQPSKRQQSHCHLPFADSENANTTQPDINQQHKKTNRSPNNNSSTSPSSSSFSRGQVNSSKPSPIQLKQNNNPVLPRITGATAKVTGLDSSSSSKLFQAPRATFDEDMFDDDETLEKSTGQHYSSRKSDQHSLNPTNHASPTSSHRSHKSPSKLSSSSTAQSDGNQCKLKPVKVNYN
ncbi:probable serine/threonine-protein kinase DDB_G0282963 isoform X1 [Tetranychus urticae]|uniref:LIM zinc-binding domain-containing protein n=1 Tax=Tetranychus urticae TaxID=32264 RepID=T1JYK1_TETUR|nr:probable serine/threonine-protein kinase DDB_G0282963 isoform X1 [Tetranychus urticae]